MGPIGCPETSVQNYHSTLRNVAEEWRSQVSYVFQPYMVIIRLVHKEENKHSCVGIDISVPYISICIKYIHSKLDSRRNEAGRSC